MGTVPTGADSDVEGESVRTDSDVAAVETTATVEDIIAEGEEARRKGRLTPAAETEPEEIEVHPVPHDKGRMQDIE